MDTVDQARALRQIQHIQAEYFELLANHFERERRQLPNPPLPENCDAFTTLVLSAPDLFIADAAGRTAMSRTLKIVRLVDETVAFWVKHRAEYWNSIASLDDLYCVVTLDEVEEINTLAKMLGLYFDKVLVAEPFLAAYDSFVTGGSHLDVTHWAIGVLQAYWTLLCSRRLFVAGIDHPFVIIYPHPVFLAPSVVSRIDDQARSEALLLLSELAGRPIESQDDVHKAWRDAGPQVFFTNETLAHEVLGEPDLGRPPETSVLANIETYRRLMSNVDEGMLVSGEIYARLRVLLLLEEISKLGPDPLVQRRTWGPYRWRLTKEKSLAASESRRDLGPNQVIAQALQHPFIEWIRDLTLEEVITLRNENELEELRQVFRIGRVRLNATKPAEMERAFARFAESLTARLEEEGARIRDIELKCRMKRRRAIEGLAAATGLFMASTLYPMIQNITGALSLVVGGKSVLDVVSAVRESKEALEHAQRRPLGYLFDVFSRHHKH